MVILDITTEEVYMPLWYWQELATFAIDTESAIERLKIELEVQE